MLRPARCRYAIARYASATGDVDDTYVVDTPRVTPLLSYYAVGCHEDIAGLICYATDIIDTRYADTSLHTYS